MSNLLFQGGKIFSRGLFPLVTYLGN